MIEERWKDEDWKVDLVIGDMWPGPIGKGDHVKVLVGNDEPAAAASAVWLRVFSADVPGGTIVGDVVGEADGAPVPGGCRLGMLVAFTRRHIVDLVRASEWDRRYRERSDIAERTSFHDDVRAIREALEYLTTCVRRLTGNE